MSFSQYETSFGYHAKNLLEYYMYVNSTIVESLMLWCFFVSSFHFFSFLSEMWIGLHTLYFHTSKIHSKILSTSIYDLVLIYVCHFHHLLILLLRVTFPQFSYIIEILVLLSWIPASKEFSLQNVTFKNFVSWNIFRQS